MKNILNYDLVVILNNVINIVSDVKKHLVTDFKIEEKDGPTNIVTSSDIAVQKYLIENITPLIPEASFYCEEGDVQNIDSDFVWVIDPIDGTENYSRGICEFGVSVALSYKKEVVLGVVYNVLRDEMYYAIKGEGSYLNGEKLQTSNRDFKHSLICIAMALYHKEHQLECNNILLETFNLCKDYRRFASAALELCYLARGEVELFFEYQLSLWDFYASALILTEAGGVIAGYNEPITFKEHSLVIAANNQTNFDILNEIVNKHIKR